MVFAVIIPFVSVIAEPLEVSARQIRGTRQENHAAYRASLENKYGYAINIDSSTLQSGGFYTPPREAGDLELRILQDIESVFAMLPDGFVKEVNDYMKNLGVAPALNIIYRPGSSRGDSELGFFEYEYEYHSSGKIIINQADIFLIREGNRFIEVLLHEFAHQTMLVLELKDKIDALEKFFTDTISRSRYPYNQNYTRLYRQNLDHTFYDYYISEYSSVDFDEDFAETFMYAVMQPRYVSSYGSGTKKPIHSKIEMMGKTLINNFNSLKNTGFLLNCLPDPASAWADTAVQNAKSQGISQWGSYGLNTHEITRYDAALILQPFLYKYIGETELFKSAGIDKNKSIPQDFVYDLADAEDVFLLNALKLLTVNSGRFNPNGKIQKQSAAVILTRIAQLFGLRAPAGAELKTADTSKVADWALSYVTFAVSMKIMGADHRNNFNPEQYITYQEFYSSLVRISGLKNEFNAKNNLKMPESQYFQILGQGTTLSSNGWIYYFNCPELDDFTGTAKYYWPNGDVYEGAWVNGYCHGAGRITFADGTVFEGEFRRDEAWNGIYTEDGINYKFENGRITGYSGS